ncbi:MAG TPA: hypothetical protein VEW68_10260, partial [Patescibacteria group bacterium]|nr:hypothetical protein [Patescibacteria group bacterium]
KTNIVDSVKWVLGSGQARDLRGKKMEEVIYAGGQRKNRASFAEVTVVFDNAEGRLPVDYSEVAIKRRVERDGESDYFLNGTRVRRRDLIHLLASTGLTLDSYAIIDQHDIEHIVVCSAAERRQLLEEAAQVRGVKARREEAVARLTELAANLTRLGDLKSEIEPRLEVLRAQAATAREAEEVGARLELLRGSIIWEEWRDARDSHRRATSQAQALERRLIEAREQARIAEAEFQDWRAEVQAAQDRRLAKQRRLGRLRLDVAEAEHALQLAAERASNVRALAAGAAREEVEAQAQGSAAEALKSQLESELEAARRSLAGIAEAPSVPDALDPAESQSARRLADQARRAASAAASSLAGLRMRREFLESQAIQLKTVEAAAAEVPGAEAELAQAARRLGDSEEAALALARMTSEMDGLDSLRPSAGDGLRLGEVLTAEPGYEAALTAVLGPLADAVVVSNASKADDAARTGQAQVTVLYPVDAPEPKPGSLYEHVRWLEQYEGIACRLLGSVVVGTDVTLDGVYREPGLVRAGTDPRLAIDMRRAGLKVRIAELEPKAAGRDELARAFKLAEARLADLRARAAGAGRSEETSRLLATAREEEESETARTAELEAIANRAEEAAAEAARALDASLASAAEARAAASRLEMDRARWRDRVDDLQRQLLAVADDLARVARSAEERRARV